MKKTAQRAHLARIMKKYIRLGLYSQSIDAFDTCRRILGASRHHSEALDLFAVWELCRLLRAEGKSEALRTYEDIYLIGRTDRRNDVSMRILNYATQNHYDVRTVYRRLAYVESRYDMIRKSL